ncbi:hypothetical protein HNR46_002538 [Haloferula luteola]|uniref:DUF3298 domain-containing protein n=1 Tax=Haloferula luteola TaxID=595692 RepID=A0A840V2S7_9BACT|nr:hypothetical protein [Haloferula luteola]MBB5352295.1 hypothetical protein [Haloferula luteola]
MNRSFPAVFAVLCASAFAQAAEVPEVLRVLPEGKLVKGATIAVVPPKELDKYLDIVETAARKNPEWFAEHSKKSAPGVPLPYHENLGLTKKEYEEYLAIWATREFRAVEPIVLRLTTTDDGMWKITTAGGAFPISTLKYDPKKDVMVSPNGELERLEDVAAEKDSILGAWTGHEWRFQEETSLGKTKENFAIGQTADGVYGMLVYRIQEVSAEGTPLYDNSIVIRFPLGEAGILKQEELQAPR